mmetsp:Transcript_1894/g.2730  ORF Transcript_1894/g.2730 Transcript_1894/m.2730 type:complete len:424 (+) Transcript_1894:14-1285(+)
MTKNSSSGRAYCFTTALNRDERNEYREIRKILQEKDVKVLEIRIDDKIFLQNKMIELVGKKQLKTPQLFFNDTYIGDNLNMPEDELDSKIKELKKGTPKELKEVYETQKELFVVNPPVFYFPEPHDKKYNLKAILTNRTDKYCAYKLQTTQRDNFVVVPKRGYIEPLKSTEIKITQKEAPSKDQDLLFRIEIIQMPFIDNHFLMDLDKLFDKKDRKISKQLIRCNTKDPLPEHLVLINETKIRIADTVDVNEEKDTSSDDEKTATTTPTPTESTPSKPTKQKKIEQVDDELTTMTESSDSEDDADNILQQTVRDEKDEQREKEKNDEALKTLNELHDLQKEYHILKNQYEEILKEKMVVDEQKQKALSLKTKVENDYSSLMKKYEAEKAKKQIVPKSEEGGFPLMMVIIVALLAFFIGNYFTK